MGNRVVVIGLDAADPDLVEGWAREGHLPFIALTGVYFLMLAILTRIREQEVWQDVVQQVFYVICIGLFWAGYLLAREKRQRFGSAGQWTLVAGYGHGSGAPAVSVGILSALDRLDGRAVQTDAKTSPANYGGPLFDVEGRVIGVCVPKAGGDDEEIAGVEWYDSGIGFAIQADYIQQRLPRLKAGRDLQRGFMGVRFDSAAPVVGSLSGWSGHRTASSSPIIPMVGVSFVFFR